MTRERTKMHDQIHYLLLACIVFTLPFYIKLNSIFILLAGANWLLAGNLFDKLKTTLNNKLNLCFIFLYLLHVISAFSSLNANEAHSILERRLSLIVFPLLLCYPIKTKQINTLLYVFITAITSAILICYTIAFQRYFSNHNTEVFYYHQFASAININAIYLSAYLVFGINILIKSWFIDKVPFKIYILILCAFFFVSLLLLSSKMMLFILTVNMIVWTFYLVKSRKALVTLICGIILFIVLTITLSTNIRSRIDTELHSNLNLVHQTKFAYNTPFTGTSLRLVIWKFCFELTHENNAWLWGVGTGDMQDLLNVKYINAGMYTGNPELHDSGYLGYGPHNEYVEIILALGIPALILLLLAFGFLLFEAVNSKNYLLIQLVILTSLFFITESALGTNKGIVFLMFFIILLNGRLKES